MFSRIYISIQKIIAMSSAALLLKKVMLSLVKLGSMRVMPIHWMSFFIAREGEGMFRDDPIHSSEMILYFNNSYSAQSEKRKTTTAY